MLSSGVSLRSERLERSERLSRLKDRAHFRTSPVNCDASRSVSAAPPGAAAASLKDFAIETQEKEFLLQVFFPLEVVRRLKEKEKGKKDAHKKHGNLWLFGDAWEVPCRPGT